MESSGSLDIIVDNNNDDNNNDDNNSSTAAMEAFEYISYIHHTSMVKVWYMVPYLHTYQLTPYTLSTHYLLKYGSMTKHLSDPEDSLIVDSNSVDEEMPVDASLVVKAVRSMRAGRSQESLVATKKDAERILDAIETLSPSKLVTMLIALGMRHERATNELTEVEKKKKLKIWATSITTCT